MQLFRYTCNIVFIIILIIFTVGYTSQPIMNVTADITISVPSTTTISNIQSNKIPSYVNGNYKFIAYTDKIVNSNDNSTINYSDLNSTLNNISEILKYVLIGTTMCIGALIILSLVRLKMISYIPLTIAQFVMISLSCLIIFLYKTDYLTSTISKYINKTSSNININNSKINIDTGGILIIVSTSLLIVTHFIYSLLG